MFLLHSRIENAHQLEELTPGCRLLAKADTFGYSSADFSVDGILDNWPVNHAALAEDSEPLLRLDLVPGRSEDRTGEMTDSELAYIAWRVIDAAPININDRPWAALATGPRIVILADVLDASAGVLDVWEVGRLAERELAAVTAQLAHERLAGRPTQGTSIGEVHLVSVSGVVAAHGGGMRARGLLHDAGFRQTWDGELTWFRTPHGLPADLIQAMADHAERVLDLGGYSVVRSTAPASAPVSPRGTAAHRAIGPTAAVPATANPPASRGR
ncbi:hypothetical protein LO772_29670 [Yinghuangia sp. ASG 101]|uniref:hypothetical protein n=1 Tax=Yinghuangia sp. ASG 101 TaxID=2896848 RepID=UPI001E637A9C|nr:hypothetical protein [Yinghuangia sp. ASG 101]UGQ10937.1 hypothetical protein LO772_29670 [Yinghuangia sp. ASG 101]